MKRMLVVFAAVVAVGMFWGVKSDAALCPAASVGTACVDFTEGTPGTSGAIITSTTVTISRDGVALAPVTIPTTSGAGGQTKFTSINTLECQSDTYTASGITNYTIGGVSFQSLAVTATPGVGVVKNRTGEAVCTTPPSGFTLH
jgi:hypothetical protein